MESYSGAPDLSIDIPHDRFCNNILGTNVLPDKCPPDIPWKSQAFPQADGRHITILPICLLAHSEIFVHQTDLSL